MSRTKLILLLLLAGCSPKPPLYRQYPLVVNPYVSKAEVFREVAKSTVVVETNAGLGSGTVIKVWPGYALVLTCAHVLHDDVKEIQVHSDRDVYPASIEDMDEYLDLALLVVKGNVKAPALAVAKLDHFPLLYDTLFMVSSPLAIPKTAQLLILSGHVKMEEKGRRLWLVTGTIIFGSSGGTITNSFGELVCVPSQTRAFVPGVPSPISFCVGLEQIHSFLTQYFLTTGVEI